jgi:hypothetical protein
MAKAKKTEKEEVVELEPIGEVKLEQKKYEDCEWCFQFDEDEPQIFAWTDPEISADENPKIIFEITNRENSYITFTNGKSGKTFKIYAREISDAGKEMREAQRQALKNSQADLENFDKNMEDYASEYKETE